MSETGGSTTGLGENHGSLVASPGNGARRNRLQVEVALVIAWFIAPNLVMALVAHVEGRDVPGFSQVAMEIQRLSSALASVAVLGFMIWSSREPLRHFGIVRFRATDLAWALGLFCASLAASFIYQQVGAPLYWLDEFRGAVYDPVEEMASPSVIGVAALLLALIANSFAEELAISAVLANRLHELLGHAAKAVLLASLLFGSYHMYYGFYGAGNAFIACLLFTGFFLWKRRIWPQIIAHTMYNAMVLIPFG